MPCGLLFGFQETETHLRARGGCHVSTFLGRDVTILLVSEHLVSKLSLSRLSSGYRKIFLAVVKLGCRMDLPPP